MPPINSGDFTALLFEFRNGNQEAAAALATLVYQELRRLAHQYMQQEAPGHLLQATALVHEVWLRLFGDGAPELKNRQHFFAVAARQMRHTLTDHARAARALKRQGQQHLLPLEEAAALPVADNQELIALEDALTSLENLFPRAAQVVELRFFGGLAENEVAAILGISVATVKRDWGFARVWLYTQVR